MTAKKRWGIIQKVVAALAVTVTIVSWFFNAGLVVVCIGISLLVLAIVSVAEYNNRNNDMYL